MQTFSYSLQDEKTLFIDLPHTSGLRIKGILRGTLSQPVAIIVHGRPGTGNELLPFLAARYLYEHGIASLRLCMYDFAPNTRNLLECTLDTHAEDFDTVVNYLRKKQVPKIFAIGHSYGGLTILKATAAINGAVLWDPTHGSYWVEHADESDENFPEKTIGDLVIGTAGHAYVSTTQANAYDKHMGDTTDWAAHKGYPLQVISAGKGAMTHLGKRYVEAADAPKQHSIIKNAHHQFEDSDEVILDLFQKTTEWLLNY